MKTLSLDLRERILASYDSEEGTRGDIVIMDHLSPHKNETTLSLITAAGASVHFLPAYSPDLNPIEKMWSKVEQCLRSAEARTAPHRRAPARKLLEASPPCATPQSSPANRHAPRGPGLVCLVRLQLYLICSSRRGRRLPSPLASPRSTTKSR